MEDLSLLGARLMRVAHGSKRPIDNWSETARLYTKEECIRAFSGLNVGVVADDRLVIIDVEGPKKQGCANGWPHLHSLQKAFGTLPMAPQYTTPSGGGGIIFRAPQNKVPFCDLSKDFGLEMRTGIHFNLLPPSFYDGKADGKTYSGTYNWLHTPEDVLSSEKEIPEIPEWLVNWFMENTTNKFETVERNVSGYIQDDQEREEYLRIVEENLALISADIPYNEWWRVMAICNQAGSKGRELFITWSQEKGGSRWNENTRMFICAQWQLLNQRFNKRKETGEPLLGLRALMGMVVGQTKPVHIEMPQKIATTIEEPQFETKWPLLPLFGALEDFRLALKASMPWQDEVCYALPLVCLQLVLQRKILYRPDSLQSHWWCFVGGPSSNKSECKRIIKEVVERVDSKILMDTFESTNGVKSMLADYPSRVLLMDEGIKVFNAVLANEGKNALDTKTLSLILNMHNNKTNMEATGNRIAAHRVPKVILPQLTIATFDQDTYWNQFRVGNAINNGLLSRFFVFTLNPMPYSSLEKSVARLPRGALEEFANALKRLIPYQEPRFSIGDDNKEELHSWSPIDMHGSPYFAWTKPAIEVFDDFNDSNIAWAKADEATRAPVFHRTVEGAKLLAQLLALADGSVRVGAEHARSACGVAFQTMVNIGKEVDSQEVEAIKCAQKVLTERGPMVATRLVRAVPQRYSRGDKGFSSLARLFKELFPVRDGKLYPVT